MAIELEESPLSGDKDVVLAFLRSLRSVQSRGTYNRAFKIMFHGRPEVLLDAAR